MTYFSAFELTLMVRVYKVYIKVLYLPLLSFGKGSDVLFGSSSNGLLCNKRIMSSGTPIGVYACSLWFTKMEH